MEPFKKQDTYIMPFLIPLTCVTLCQFYSITSRVLFTKKNKLWNERKEVFLTIWLLQFITLYQRKQKMVSSDKIQFLDMQVFIHNSYCQGNSLRSYFFVFLVFSLTFAYSGFTQKKNVCASLCLRPCPSTIFFGYNHSIV